jgi:hypothetical protein
VDVEELPLAVLIIVGIALHLLFIPFLATDLVVTPNAKFIWKDLIYITAIAIAYLVMHLGYVFGTGDELYPEITWTNVVSYMIALVFTVCLPLSYLAARYLERLRDRSGYCSLN